MAECDSRGPVAGRGRRDVSGRRSRLVWTGRRAARSEECGSAHAHVQQEPRSPSVWPRREGPWHTVCEISTKWGNRGSLSIAPSYAVDRPELWRRLDDALTRPLTVVVAPPGSGKTVLLANGLARTRNAPSYGCLSIRRQRRSPLARRMIRRSQPSDRVTELLSYVYLSGISWVARSSRRSSSISGVACRSDRRHR